MTAESWAAMLTRHHSEKMARIQDAISRGLTGTEAAAEMACEASILHGFCRDNGIKWPRKPESETPRYKRRAALCALGLSVEEMAKREGIKPDSLRAYLARNEIETPL
ncbi:hypothetical protein [Phaeobacter sp. S60]|uniref:hypothetical protein n=1 Tax=Phaeobacter sp. S60 TaxID=1569353 RepID=UPI00058D565B|nr:hypothetical protein [Phaeobacter sp. S60]KII11357.1 hypothetical protein OO25_21520 [Phaeobacter sp. S60]